MYRGKYITSLRRQSASSQLFSMRGDFIRIIFFLLLFLIPFPVVSQLDNSILLDRYRRPEGKVNDLFLGIRTLGYNKNNEYFENTATGYTLFGYNLRPEIVYVPSKYAVLSAGIFLQRDFGTLGYFKVQPTYAIQLYYDSLTFYFGNIRGPLEHNYIEPLYDFEKVVFDNPEEGLQILYKRNRFSFDGWINWDKMIYDRSPFREEFTGGVVAEYKFIDNPRFTWSVPFQWIATHVGGQIDNDTTLAQTVENFASGLNFEFRFPNAKIVQAIRSQNYLAYYNSFEANPLQPPYTNGWGAYMNLTMVTKLNDFMISYWRGDQFISYSGGALYQSISRNWKEPLALEEIREIIIFRVLGKINVFEDLQVSPRLEPYWNLQTDRKGISFGVYVKYQHDFFLTKIRK